MPNISTTHNLIFIRGNNVNYNAKHPSSRRISLEFTGWPQFGQSECNDWLAGFLGDFVSEQNGWISIDDARFPLSKYKGDEVVIRTKANNYKWVYQIAVVDSDGNVVIDPCVMCSRCGDALQWKPHAWNPFSKMPAEWKPLGKFIDADRRVASFKAEAEMNYNRALKAEELLYRFYIDRDKKAEEAILTFVQDGLYKEGL